MKVKVELHMDVAWLATVAAAYIRPALRQKDQCCGFWEPMNESLHRSGSEKQPSCNQPQKKLGQLLGHTERYRGESGVEGLVGGL